MPFPDNVNFRQWAQTVREMMRKYQRRAGKYRYTLASPDDEGHQSPEQSALYAVAYRWIDSEMASDELIGAVSQQLEGGEDAGKIPAGWRWQSDGTALVVHERLAAALLSYATVQVYHIGGDYNLLEKIYPRLLAWHGWLDHHGSAGLQLREQLQRALDLNSLAHIASDMGKQDDAARLQERADAAKQQAPVMPADQTYDWLIPATLFCGAATPEQAQQTVDDLLQRPDSLWTACGIASEKARVSIAGNWMLYVGLRRYGFNRLATELAEKSVRLVERHGFHESYDAHTGAPDGHEHPAAALILDMLARELQGGPAKAHCRD